MGVHKLICLWLASSVFFLLTNCQVPTGSGLGNAGSGSPHSTASTNDVYYITTLSTDYRLTWMSSADDDILADAKLVNEDGALYKYDVAENILLTLRHEIEYCVATRNQAVVSGGESGTLKLLTLVVATAVSIRNNCVKFTLDEQKTLWTVERQTFCLQELTSSFSTKAHVGIGDCDTATYLTKHMYDKITTQIPYFQDTNAIWTINDFTNNGKIVADGLFMLTINFNRRLGKIFVVKYHPDVDLRGAIIGVADDMVVLSQSVDSEINFDFVDGFFRPRSREIDQQCLQFINGLLQLTTECTHKTLFRDPEAPNELIRDITISTDSIYLGINEVSLLALTPRFNVFQYSNYTRLISINIADELNCIEEVASILSLTTNPSNCLPMIYNETTGFLRTERHYKCVFLNTDEETVMMDDCVQQIQMKDYSYSFQSKVISINGMSLVEFAIGSDPEETVEFSYSAGDKILRLRNNGMEFCLMFGSFVTFAEVQYTECGSVLVLNGDEIRPVSDQNSCLELIGVSSLSFGSCSQTAVVIEDVPPKPTIISFYDAAEEEMKYLLYSKKLGEFQLSSDYYTVFHRDTKTGITWSSTEKESCLNLDHENGSPTFDSNPTRCEGVVQDEVKNVLRNEEDSTQCLYFDAGLKMSTSCVQVASLTEIDETIPPTIISFVGSDGEMKDLLYSDETFGLSSEYFTVFYRDFITGVIWLSEAKQSCLNMHRSSGNPPEFTSDYTSGCEGLVYDELGMQMLRNDEDVTECLYFDHGLKLSTACNHVGSLRGLNEAPQQPASPETSPSPQPTTPQLTGSESQQSTTPVTGSVAQKITLSFLTDTQYPYYVYLNKRSEIKLSTRYAMIFDYDTGTKKITLTGASSGTEYCLGEYGQYKDVGLLVASDYCLQFTYDDSNNVIRVDNGFNAGQCLMADTSHYRLKIMNSCDQKSLMRVLDSNSINATAAPTPEPYSPIRNVKLSFPTSYATYNLLVTDDDVLTLSNDSFTIFEYNTETKQMWVTLADEKRYCFNFKGADQPILLDNSVSKCEAFIHNENIMTIDGFDLCWEVDVELKILLASLGCQQQTMMEVVEGPSHIQNVQISFPTSSGTLNLLATENGLSLSNDSFTVFDYNTETQQMWVTLADEIRYCLEYKGADNPIRLHVNPDNCDAFIHDGNAMSIDVDPAACWAVDLELMLLTASLKCEQPVEINGVGGSPATLAPFAKPILNITDVQIGFPTNFGTFNLLVTDADSGLSLSKQMYTIFNYNPETQKLWVRLDGERYCINYNASDGSINLSDDAADCEAFNFDGNVMSISGSSPNTCLAFDEKWQLTTSTECTQEVTMTAVENPVTTASTTSTTTPHSHIQNVQLSFPTSSGTLNLLVTDADSGLSLSNESFTIFDYNTETKRFWVTLDREEYCLNYQNDGSMDLSDDGADCEAINFDGNVMSISGSSPNACLAIDQTSMELTTSTDCKQNVTMEVIENLVTTAPTTTPHSPIQNVQLSFPTSSGTLNLLVTDADSGLSLSNESFTIFDYNTETKKFWVTLDGEEYCINYKSSDGSMNLSDDDADCEAIDFDGNVMSISSSWPTTCLAINETSMQLITSIDCKQNVTMEVIENPVTTAPTTTPHSPIQNVQLSFPTSSGTLNLLVTDADSGLSLSNESFTIFDYNTETKKFWVTLDGEEYCINYNESDGSMSLSDDADMCEAIDFEGNVMSISGSSPNTCLAINETSMELTTSTECKQEVTMEVIESPVTTAPTTTPHSPIQNIQLSFPTSSGTYNLFVTDAHSGLSLSEDSFTMLSYNTETNKFWVTLDGKEYCINYRKSEGTMSLSGYAESCEAINFDGDVMSISGSSPNKCLAIDEETKQLIASTDCDQEVTMKVIENPITTAPTTTTHSPIQNVQLSFPTGSGTYNLLVTDAHSGLSLSEDSFTMLSYNTETNKFWVTLDGKEYCINYRKSDGTMSLSGSGDICEAINFDGNVMSISGSSPNKCLAVDDETKQVIASTDCDQEVTMKVIENPVTTASTTKPHSPIQNVQLSFPTSSGTLNLLVTDAHSGLTLSEDSFTMLSYNTETNKFWVTLDGKEYCINYRKSDGTMSLSDYGDRCEAINFDGDVMSISESSPNKCLAIDEETKQLIASTDCDQEVTMKVIENPITTAPTTTPHSPIQNVQLSFPTSSGTYNLLVTDADSGLSLSEDSFTMLSYNKETKKFWVTLDGEEYCINYKSRDGSMSLSDDADKCEAINFDGNVMSISGSSPNACLAIDGKMQLTTSTECKQEVSMKVIENPVTTAPTTTPHSPIQNVQLSFPTSSGTYNLLVTDADSGLSLSEDVFTMFNYNTDTKELMVTIDGEEYCINYKSDGSMDLSAHGNCEAILYEDDLMFFEGPGSSKACLAVDEETKQLITSAECSQKIIMEEIETSITTTTQSTDKSFLWDNWSTWSSCNVICGTGSQKRHRTCITSPKIICQGLSYESRLCIGEGDCSAISSPLQTDEGEPLSCDDACGAQGKQCDPYMQTGGTIDLFKILGYSCSTKEPIWNVPYAPYYNTKTKKCAGYEQVPKELDCAAKPTSTNEIRICKCIMEDDINMVDWSPWSQCSATCAGKRSRARSCKINTGTSTVCSTRKTDIEDCNTDPCPVHGGLTEWSVWSQCSEVCGGGIQERNRACTNPMPAHGGLQCVGKAHEQRQCNRKMCPVDGVWSGWTVESACTKGCGGGVTFKERFCTNPKPLYGGLDCADQGRVENPCNDNECPGVVVGLEVRFDLQFLPPYQERRSNEYEGFKRNLQIEVVAGTDERYAASIYEVRLDNLRYDISGILQEKATSQDVEVKIQGSVIATFTVVYSQVDSGQLFTLQQSIQDGAIGKLPIVMDSDYTLNVAVVPSSPPSNIGFTATPTTIRAHWGIVDADSQNGNITGYLLFYRETIKNSDPFQVYATQNFSLEVYGLKPSTRYSFQLLAYTNNGNGVSSPTLVTTTAQAAPEEPVTNIETHVINSTAVFCQWNGVSQVHMNGEPGWYRLNFSAVGRVPVVETLSYPVSQVTLNVLRSATNYLLTVCPFNNAGDGPCENAEFATPPSAPTLPPTNLTSVGRTPTSHFLRWNPLILVNEDLENFVLEYHVVEQDNKLVHYAPIKSMILPPSITSLALMDLKPNTKYKIVLMGSNRYGHGPTISIVVETCRCPQRVYTNYYLQKPFVSRVTGAESGDLTSVFPTLLDEMIQLVCGTCESHPDEGTTIDYTSNGKYQFASKSNLNRVVEDIDAYTQLSFPLVTNPAEENVDARFIPVVPYPGALYFTKDKDISDYVKHVAGQIFEIWPIFVINFLLAILFGGAVWFLEVYLFADTNEEFSDGKKIGIAQGWYWAYVTQTTIGYGDFYPTGKLSRFVAIFWIVISLVTSSILLGFLTSAFTSTMESENSFIYGKKVAALTGSFEERLAVLKNGDLDQSKNYSSIGQLVHALLEGHVTGILIDAYDAGENPDDLDVPLVRPLAIIEYPRYYGVVVSGSLAFIENRLNDYVRANKGYIQEVVEKFTTKIHPVEAAESMSLFDPESTLLRKTLLSLAILLVMVSILGFIISFWLQKRKAKKVEPVKSKQEELGELTKDCLAFSKSFKRSLIALRDRFDEERVKLYFEPLADNFDGIDDEKAIAQKKNKRKKQYERRSTMVTITDSEIAEDHSGSMYSLTSHKRIDGTGQEPDVVENDACVAEESSTDPIIDEESSTDPIIDDNDNDDNIVEQIPENFNQANAV